MAIRRSRNRRRLGVVIVVVAVIAALAFGVLSVITLKKEQHDMRQQAEELEAEKAQLEKDLSQINDPANLEEQARDQLRLIKEGEFLYVFPDEITNSDKDSSDQDPEEE